MQVPSDVLHQVFQYLSQRERALCTRVCKNWCIPASKRLWSKPELSSFDQFVILFKAIEQTPKQWTGMQFWHEWDISNTPYLSMFLDHTKLVKTLSLTNNLHHLALDQCLFVDDACLMHLCMLLPHLDSLSLKNCYKITEKSIIFLSDTFKTGERLCHLNLSGLQRLSNHGLLHLGEQMGSFLKTLDITSCFQITGKTVIRLVDRLRSRIGDKEGQQGKLVSFKFSHLQGIIKLDKILNGLVKHQPHLTELDVGFPNLDELMDLDNSAHLRPVYRPFTDFPLKLCMQLTSLTLSNVKFLPNESLISICTLTGPHLVHLGLRKIKVSEDLKRALCHFVDLQSLSIHECKGSQKLLLDAILQPNLTKSVLKLELKYLNQLYLGITRLMQAPFIRLQHLSLLFAYHVPLEAMQLCVTHLPITSFDMTGLDMAEAIRFYERVLWYQ
ncbi:hypothetical protein EDD86DRAFT_266731 [Gorgonomyces haynaldii]|nr:hypothetical protein EDD86DRAFT_266731 [Gorgonomyces haynaldii]